MKSNDVAIVTFHNAINYGAVLQTYALSTFLRKEFNIKAEILDYRCKKVENTYKYYRYYPDRGFWFSVVKMLLDLHQRFILKKKYSLFLRKYLAISAMKYDRDNIHEALNKYDFFLVGSDQVWNGDITGNDLTYFFDFVNEGHKKASYAASFGFTDSILLKRKNIINLLSSFCGISLREEIGLDIIKDAGLSPQVHVDPALLLTREHWSKLSEPFPVNSKYIFLFTVLPAKDLIEFSRKLAEKTNLPVIYLTDSIRFYKNIKKIKGAGPNQFLWLIENAEYVCTTSFHGVIFSILFQKKFFTEIQSTEKYNARVDHILKLLHLKDREISTGESLDTLIEREIDWANVEQILERERKRSSEYLRKVINE